MNLGAFTGDPSKAASYLYGLHWINKKGYKVIRGNDKYGHRFGGCDWDIPICQNCNELYHQIFTFDLSDPKLKNLAISLNNELPLISCLNCSSSWERQLYRLDFDKKVIKLLEVSDTQRFIQDDACKIVLPLPKHNVTLMPLDEYENPIDEQIYYSLMNSIDENYLCRILGAPLLESPIDAECPLCKKEMLYIGAIYSQPLDSENIFPDVEFFLGEMSLYYHFCLYCHVIKVESQGT